MFALRRALDVQVDTTVTDDGALRTDALRRPGRAGRDGSTRAAHRTRAAGGLEDMFLQLTADTQRERTAA